MKTKNNKRTAYKLSLIMFLLLLIPAVTALTIEVPEVISAKEGDTISFEIKIKNNLSPVNITRSPNIGEISSENEYTWIVNYGNETYKEITFTAEDNTTNTTAKTTLAKPPEISVLMDKNINKNNYEFSLNTTLEATCKYGLSNKEYKDLEYTMNTKNGKEHEGITPKLSQKTHTVYVICRTEKGGEVKTSFKLQVNLAPTSEIRLKPPPPLRSGIIEIELVASEDLISAPELRYFFDDDSTLRTITLTGSNTVWNGHMVIQESARRRIGTFIFKGTDKTNLEGTEITSGKTFVVDNYKPSVVSSFQGIVESDRIKLGWKYLDDAPDDIKEYRIYRRTSSGGVEYVDYHTTTSDDYYYDRDVSYGEAYYYKVTAVNGAGREGELSKEVALTFMPKREEETTSEKQELSPVLKTQLRTIISQTDKILLDIELIESDIKRKTDNEALLVQDLNILSKIVSSKNKVNNIIDELEELENQKLTTEEFDLATNTFLEEARTTFKEVPQNVKIIDIINYQEPQNEEVARKTIEKHLEKENFNLTLKKTQEFIEQLITDQNSFLISVSVIRAQITYEDEKEDVTYITKKISSQKEIEEVTILDNIQITDLDELVFLTRPTSTQETIKKWEITSIENRDLKYYAKKDISLEEIRNTKIIIIEEKELHEKKNLLTGMVTKERGEGFKHPLLIPVIIGVLSVLVLSVYYFKEDVDLDIVSVKNLFSLPSISMFKKRKMKDAHKKLNLEDPPTEKEVVELTKQEAQEIKEFTENKEQNEQGTEENETKTQTKPPLQEKDEEAIETIHELKNMIEEIYYDDDFDEFDYIAKIKQIKKKYSRGAPQGKEFVLRDGTIITNIKQLIRTLRNMDQETFHYHVNPEKNDFYNWVKDVFKYKGLAYKIRRVKTKKELIKKLKP